MSLLIVAQKAIELMEARAPEIALKLIGLEDDFVLRRRYLGNELRVSYVPGVFRRARLQSLAELPISKDRYYVPDGLHALVAAPIRTPGGKGVAVDFLLLVSQREGD
jgi:hypothetical protein